jgi:hypothetical protein
MLVFPGNIILIIHLRCFASLYLIYSDMPIYTVIIILYIIRGYIWHLIIILYIIRVYIAHNYITLLYNLIIYKNISCIT